MNTAIYKYQLDILDEQIVELPKDHKILSVGNQRGCLCMWVIVNVDSTSSVPVTIGIYGTGNPIDEHRIDGFIGTVVIEPFVWHVFRKR